MVLQIFPEPTTSSVDGYSYSVPAANKQYQISQTFTPGVYTITTFPTTSQATIEFVCGTSVNSTTTTSGTVSYQLAETATNTVLSIDTGTNVVVTITQTSAIVSGSEISGTLDTITSSGTYNQTGKLYVVAVGGGGGGGNAGTDGNFYSYGGGGGGAGSYVSKLVYTNTATSITIGSAGTGGLQTANALSNAGGTTNFGNLLSATGGGAGGRAGLGDYSSASYGGGNGGLENVTARAGLTLTANAKSVINGNNGGGGAGAYGVTGGEPAPAGGGSGIGTGGSGAHNLAANAGSGYGSGGGGGIKQNVTNNEKHKGQSGGPGVVYVLRGF
jgi:hypothetical protein